MGVKRPILIPNFVCAVWAAELGAGTESRALRWHGSSCGGLGCWINISLLLQAGPCRAAGQGQQQCYLQGGKVTCFPASQLANGGFAAGSGEPRGRKEAAG